MAKFNGIKCKIKSVFLGGSGIMANIEAEEGRPWNPNRIEVQDNGAGMRANLKMLDLTPEEIKTIENESAAIIEAWGDPLYIQDLRRRASLNAQFPMKGGKVPTLQPYQRQGWKNQDIQDDFDFDTEMTFIQP